MSDLVTIATGPSETLADTWRLIFAFGGGKQDDAQILAEIVVRRADEIADVFDDQHVHLVQIELRRRFGNHVRVQMANCAGGNLNHRDAGALEPGRIVVRGEITHDDADAQLARELAAVSRIKVVLPEPGEETTFSTSSFLARKKPRLRSAKRLFFSMSERLRSSLKRAGAWLWPCP